MILVPCSTGTEALFVPLVDGQPNPGAGVLGVPVEAWDDQGRPLVAGRNALVLVGAFRNNRFVFDRLAIRTTASRPDAEEPQRRPVEDPGDATQPGGG